MRIVVTGTRGIPDIQGGVETHCEKLYPRLVKMGYKVCVIRRKSYVQPENKKKHFHGVKLVDVPTPGLKSLEAFVHTFLAVIRAWFMAPDLLHIHAIGPSLMVPFARLLGMKVVVTNHGPDYEREKWGKLAKFVLRLGERIGTRFANELIVISEPIRKSLKEKYGRDNTHLIYNGVEKPKRAKNTDYLESLGIEPGNYLFAAGRFVPEKGFIDLIKAWDQLPHDNRPQLVIAGDADHETCFSQGVKKHAKKYGAILTGFVKGEKLNQLFTHARLFVMPSYHEGLPIALLEALSYGLDVVVSDIPANLEVPVDDNCFFRTGDKEALTKAIQFKLEQSLKPNYEELLKEYNWDLIALQTHSVYTECLKDQLSVGLAGIRRQIAALRSW